MDLKRIQGQLKILRDRIKDRGEISDADEMELKRLIRATLQGANEELEGINGRLKKLTQHKANDNALSEEQKAKLAIMEKTGTGSCAVH